MDDQKIKTTLNNRINKKAVERSIGVLNEPGAVINSIPMSYSDYMLRYMECYPFIHKINPQA